jgi:hypothetical protein
VNDFFILVVLFDVRALTALATVKVSEPAAQASLPS